VTTPQANQLGCLASHRRAGIRLLRPVFGKLRPREPKGRHALDVKSTCRAVDSTRWQIFLCDPNNVEIELNFETKNETGAAIC
jgi:hypothetical protein